MIIKQIFLSILLFFKGLLRLPGEIETVLYGPPPEPTTEPTVVPTSPTAPISQALYAPPPNSGVIISFISILIVVPVFVIGAVAFFKKSKLGKGAKAAIIAISALAVLLIGLLIIYLVSSR